MNKCKQITLTIVMLIMVVVMSVMFTACGGKKIKSITSIEDVSATIQSNPQIYEIEKTIHVGGLTNNAHLIVGKQGDKYLAKYDYSAQKFNLIGTEIPTEQITNTSGIKYYDGEKVGEVKEGALVWTDETPTDITKFNLVLTTASLQSDYTIVMENGKATLQGTIADTQVLALFGVESGLVGVRLEVNIDVAMHRVTSIKLAYSKNNLACDIAMHFGYTPHSIIIPSVS